MTTARQATWLLAALLPLAAPAGLSAAPTPAPAPEVTVGPDLRPAGVFGRVLGEVQPLEAVRVYAYQLADFSMERVVTDEDGAFRFPDLPAGLYKIIAHKAGFVPAVVMLTRARQDAKQFLEVELAAEASAAGSAEDFWSVRDRIPPDVLREMDAPGVGPRLADSRFGPAGPAGFRSSPTLDHRFATEMEAMTGVEHLPASGEALLSGGQVGFEGSMGGLRLGVSGDYWRLGPGGGVDPAGDVDGLARHLALEVEGSDSQLLVSTLSQHLAGSGDEPVDYEAHRLSWGKRFESSRAHVAAQYTSQDNYYADAAWAPAEVPRSSTAWELEGSYTLEASERSSFQAGLRYRDRAVGLAPVEAFPDDRLTGDALQDERLDLFGRGGVRMRPTVLVEYGLYTTLRDGSLSLTPHGGLVLQLGDDWRASALASGKVSTDGMEGPRDFIPAFYHASNPCTQGEESCYKVSLSRETQGGESGLSVGAVQREIGETLRLFFDDDFFNHVESLYLVRGDELPELQLGVSRRVSPKILARVESNVGEGGGGIVYATDRERYENSVRYLVTSVDTRFQGTETGLFVSFHHLEQELDPIRGGLRAADQDRNRLELQRLQLMLTQDLDILFDLAADWALKLNMEVSRGSVLFGAPTGDADELRRKILGGFAVKF